MPNLLYVTPEMLRKLQKHQAVKFWNGLLFNFPIRQIPLEERAFHPRKIKVEDGGIYLTVDLKFVYCRDGLCSFLYESQDLSFRLTPVQGVLQTVDGKQFSAVIGRVATVISTADVELSDTDKVYHAWFDEGGFTATANAQPRRPSTDAEPDDTAAATAKVAKKPTKDDEKPVTEAAAAAAAAAKKPTGGGAKVLDKYDKAMCDQLVNFRTSSKKSYIYLSQKFSVPLEDVKRIVELQLREASATPTPGRAGMASVPRNIREQVIRMKQVAKKSYEFLADRFKLSQEVIKAICSENLKRPRH